MLNLGHKNINKYISLLTLLANIIDIKTNIKFVHTL